MDGIANVAGVRTVPLKIGEKVYTLTPMVLSEYGEREAYILSLRPDPWERLKTIPENLPEWSREKVLQQIMDDVNREARMPQIVTMAEETRFDQSLHGIGWRLMRSLRKHHPEIDTVEKALALIEQAGSDRLAEIDAKLSLSEEKDLLGKSTSPAQAPAATGAANGHGPQSTAI
jgi:hypothetical protein